MRFQAPESLAEQIALHVGRRIIRGEMLAGQRIQELKVAAELDVSRGSVREALLILERRHLIEIFPRRGAVVAEMSPRLVNSLYDVYINLLTMLLERVAEMWKQDDLKLILEKAVRVRRMIDSPERSLEDVMTSGFELIEMCFVVVRNPFLSEVLENLRPAVSRCYYLALERYEKEILHVRQFYDELVNAAQARNRDMIRRVIRAYGDHQREIVLETLRDKALAEE